MIPKNLVEGRKLVDKFRIDHVLIPKTGITGSQFKDTQRSLFVKLEENIRALGYKDYAGFWVENNNYINNATAEEAKEVTILWT